MSDLRAVRCWCGELVVADDDVMLVSELRAHVAEEHPDESRSDEELRERVATKAEEAPDRPPWAY
jgi:regulator of RNase E activity RraA